MTISSPPNANSSPPRIALVVGVNGSPASGLAPLRYAEATAQQIDGALAAPACGFTLHGDGPLLGDQATTDAVRSAVFAARRAA